MTVQLGPVVVHGPIRIVVDPNTSSSEDGTVSLARLEDASDVPHVDQIVFAVQPDDDGTEAGAFGRVTHVDALNRLIYVRVDWRSFRELEPPPLMKIDGRFLLEHSDARATAHRWFADMTVASRDAGAVDSQPTVRIEALA